MTSEEPSVEALGEAEEPPPEPAHAQAEAEPATEGEPASGETESSSADDEPNGSEEASTAEDGAGGAADPGKKKKRRRRRKKKPGEGAATTDGKPQTRPPPPRVIVPFRVGEEVFGKVTAVLDGAIMIDLSGKALGIFDRSEMAADDLVPEIGDRFVASVIEDGARGGLVVLSRKPLREEETKPKLEEAVKAGEHVNGLVTGVVRGGIDVFIGGVRAFAPASGIDLHPQNANFLSLIGQVLDFKILEFDKGGRDVVVSRRPMLEAEAHERRKKALEVLTEGQVLGAVVRTVVEWGMFVALPSAANLEGLVHVTEATHDPRAKLTDLYKPGDELEVKITKIDDKGKIWLSRRALIPDPWGEARGKHPKGTRAKGKVTRVEGFGAFIELEPGVEGLLHVSDLGFDRVEDPKKILSVDQEIDVIVQDFDVKSHRIVLHPAPPADRAGEPQQRVAKNAGVKVAVVKPEGSAGLVVRILGVTGRGARGFIPAGQTGTERGTDLRKHFKPGTVLDAKVLEIDPRRGEAKLSLRAFAADEEKRAHRDYRQQLEKETAGFGTLGDLLAAKRR